MSNLNGEYFQNNEPSSLQLLNHTSRVNFSETLEENFDIEKFFDCVDYDDKLKDYGQYIINIKDNILLKLDNSKIHLVQNNDTLLLYLCFKDGKNRLFKIDLKIKLELLSYNVEINEDYMKIILFSKYMENNLERLTKRFSYIQKFIYQKILFRKISENIFKKALCRNADFIYQKKLKNKLFDTFKVFYLYSIKKKVLDFKTEKLKKKFLWREFIENFKTCKDNKNYNFVLREVKHTIFECRVFFIRLFDKISEAEFLKNENELKKEEFNFRIKNMWHKKILNFLKIYHQQIALNKNNDSVSTVLKSYFTKSRFFKVLKNNFYAMKTLKEKAENSYLNNLKNKALYSLKIYKIKNLLRKENSKKFNMVNFMFLNFLSNKINLSNIILSDNLLNNESLVIYKNQFYFRPIRNFLNILKNYYFKKLIVYNNFAKIVYKKYLIRQMTKKNTLKRQIILSLNLKIEKYRQDVKSTFDKLIHFKVESIIQNRLNDKIRKVILNKTYYIFITNIFRAIKNATERKIKSQILAKKMLRFKFFQFISSLYLKRQIDKSLSQYKKVLMSPKNFKKRNVAFLQNYRKMISYDFYLRKLYRVCFLSKKFKNNKALISDMKKNKCKQFFEFAKNKIKMKKKKKMFLFKIKKLFFDNVEDNLKDKKLLGCAAESRDEKLKKMSFFVLRHYSTFRKEKNKRYSYFSKKLNCMIKKYYFSNIITKPYNYGRLEILFKNRKEEHTIENIFYTLKKLWHLRKLKKKIQNCLKNKYLVICNNVVKKSKKFEKKNIKVKTFIWKLHLDHLKQVQFFRNLNKENNSFKSKIKNFQFWKFLRKIKSGLDCKKSKRLVKVKYFYLMILKKINFDLDWKLKVKNLSKKLYENLFYKKTKNNLKLNSIYNKINQNYHKLLINKYFSKMSFISKFTLLSILMNRIYSIYNKLNFKHFIYQAQIFDKLKIFNNKVKKIEERFFLRKLFFKSMNNKDFKIATNNLQAKYYLKNFIKGVLNAMIDTSLEEKRKKFISLNLPKYVSGFKKNVIKRIKIKNEKIKQKKFYLDNLKKTFKKFKNNISSIVQENRINKVSLLLFNNKLKQNLKLFLSKLRKILQIKNSLNKMKSKNLNTILRTSLRKLKFCNLNYKKYYLKKAKIKFKSDLVLYYFNIFLERINQIKSEKFRKEKIIKELKNKYSCLLIKKYIFRWREVNKYNITKKKNVLDKFLENIKLLINKRKVYKILKEKVKTCKAYSYKIRFNSFKEKIKMLLDRKRLSKTLKEKIKFFKIYTLQIQFNKFQDNVKMLTFRHNKSKNLKHHIVSYKTENLKKIYFDNFYSKTKNIINSRRDTKFIKNKVYLFITSYLKNLALSKLKIKYYAKGTSLKQKIILFNIRKNFNLFMSIIAKLKTRMTQIKLTKKSRVFEVIKNFYLFNKNLNKYLKEAYN
jgi:hypothetical protein